MRSINDGGSAFPIPLDDRPGAYQAEPGMSLRDYFAAKALAAIYMEADDDDHSAQRAYELADAMLKARLAK